MSAKWVSFFMSLLVFSMAPGILESRDCIDYEDYVHWVGGIDTPDQAMGVAVSGTYAYVADGYSGLQVVDIANPQSPAIVGSVDTLGEAWGIAVSGTYAHLADWTSGLDILSAQCDVVSIDGAGGDRPSLPHAFRLSQNYPNPFNPSTTIEYSIPEDAGNVEVLIVIYDLRGRLVKKLVDGEEGAGHYRVHWDGKDERGQNL